MVFSSPFFLLVFLPLFLLCYYLTPLRYRSMVILLGSYAFYAWWRVDFLMLFFAATIWNYLLGLKIAATLDTPYARRWLTLGVCVDLMVLGYFKYADFGLKSFNELMRLAGSEPWPLTHLILPIGISFYVFESISYLVDVYRKETPATRRLDDFAAFLALFPHLIAGPVIRFRDLASQFRRREHSVRLFSMGVMRFMQGFVKKIVIADSVATVADAAFSLSDPGFSDAWVGTLAYTIQLYFDFSGYSDMAIGLGMMIGFRLNENFNHPYVSQSITEFWRRWHISLSTWLRDYLYISLGGSRHGSWKTYRNLIITMLLGGLWHGANWTFVIWGGWHGLWLALERRFDLGKQSGFSLWSWGFTLLLVMLGWVMFRSPTVSQAFVFYKTMFSIPPELALSSEFSLAITRQALLMLLIGIMLIGWSLFPIRLPQLRRALVIRQLAALQLVVQLPLFLLALSKLVSSSYSPFLYFQF
jgi:alginate O-acetyltransferase complex protein AlgI